MKSRFSQKTFVRRAARRLPSSETIAKDFAKYFDDWLRYSDNPQHQKLYIIWTDPLLIQENLGTVDLWERLRGQFATLIEEQWKKDDEKERRKKKKRRI
jgi:hypothetical protein